MDRIIVYPGSIPQDTDLLGTNRNVMLALHALIAATLGTATAVDGLGVSPTSPASMNIVIAPGSLTQYGPVDASGYGSIAADTLDQIVKQAIQLSSVTMSVTAPATSGTTIAYLLEATFNEADTNAVVLPYYNAANPTQPYLGPGNNGSAQNTLRQQSVLFMLKAGAAAPSGTQTVPPLDPGFVALGAIEVPYGATAITSAMIFPAPTTRFVNFKLPDLRPGFAAASAFTASGSFVVPQGVTRAKVTVIGGGGAGGTHATQPGGGGGAGGQAIGWLSGLTPGATIAVTVGGGGQPASGAGNGGNGQASSFGSTLSASGGTGGGGGSGSGTPAGGQGGVGSGGGINLAGSWGGDASPASARGGDGGGPGSGKGGTGATGQNAPLEGYGGGGGGGGVNLSGGAGGGGLVLVEY
ncbi:MAG TPA: hypothetical protein VFN46_08420 [Acetobacteraceae bacterium]|nr:hypothetical protein [Acetobacteraceae bacterium]